MITSAYDDAVSDTTKNINKLLSELEQKTGSHIVDISINSIDVSTYLSVGKLLMRTVLITLKPPVGSMWQKD